MKKKGEERGEKGGSRERIGERKKRMGLAFIRNKKRAEATRHPLRIEGAQAQ